MEPGYDGPQEVGCGDDGGANMCSTPSFVKQEPKANRKRTKELMLLAESIAAMVEAQTERRERCRLRQMVEMFLN